MMRHALVPLALAVAVAVAATAVLTQADPPEERASPTPGVATASVTHERVPTVDGVEIAVTVHKPAGASAESPVPVVLHSHGWAGSRDKVGTGIVGRLVGEGFGVVSVDARGHGESGGLATVHHRDHEVRDGIALLDWIHDHLDWVQKQPESGIPKDVVAGGAGYSYGGGFQLTLASHDPRLDAIAPEITWSFLPDALAPQGVVKSAWVHFLVASAEASGTRVDPRIHEWYATAMATNAFPDEAFAHFVGSSPVLEEIRADVLLVQGVPDVLFNLNHALRTHRALDADPARDVRLFTHLTGHVAPGLQPLGTSAERREIFADEGPCGRVADAVLAWLDHHLRGGPEPGLAEAAFALDDGSCLPLDAVPAAAHALRADAALAPAGAGTLLVPLGEGPMVIAGAPLLNATVDAAAGEGVAFASLVAIGQDGFVRVLDDQTQPVRLAPGAEVGVELVAVAARLEAGDRLALRLDGLNEWYATNSDRAPRAALLRDLVVTLPLAPADASRLGGQS